MADTRRASHGWIQIMKPVPPNSAHSGERVVRWATRQARSKHASASVPLDAASESRMSKMTDLTVAGGRLGVKLASKRSCASG